MGDVLDPKAILVTDAAAAFRKFAEQSGMQHVWVNPNQGIRKQGIYHIQRANWIPFPLEEVDAPL